MIFSWQVCYQESKMSLIRWAGNTFFLWKTESSLSQLPVASNSKRQMWGTATLHAHKMGNSAGAQTLPMQKTLHAKSEFWSLQVSWAVVFQRGAQKKVVAGSNYFHRNYFASLRGMGMRFSQATIGISSYLPILLGFECQVLAAIDITSISISLDDCFLYRGSESGPHEIEYNAFNSNRPHKLPSSFHFGVKVPLSQFWFFFFFIVQSLF